MFDNTTTTQPNNETSPAFFSTIHISLFVGFFHPLSLFLFFFLLFRALVYLVSYQCIYCVLYIYNIQGEKAKEEDFDVVNMHVTHTHKYRHVFPLDPHK